MADNFFEAVDDVFCIRTTDPKILCHFPGQLQIQCVIGICDVELQAVCVRHRVHVIGGRQSPSPTRIKDKTVVTQMIVAVGDQDVEHNPRPQLSKVSVGLRAVFHEHFG
ncbi:hypothetical protein D3C72_1773370 [compost metagenome]